MWQDILKTVAPILGGAVGGPMGAMATKWLATEFLGDAQASEDDVAQAIINADPVKLLELKQLDTTFQIEMRKLGIKESQLINDDRNSARQLFRVNKWPQIILSAIFIVGYFLILSLLVSGTLTISSEVKDTVILLIGLLTREVPTIMQFWFGSSSGSKDKIGELVSTL